MSEGDLVLIVEDNPDQAFALAELLKLSGFRAATTATLAAALAALPDGVVCVVLDLSLPDARGTEGVAALVAAHPSVPVVVVTGAVGMERACLHAGAQEVLSKLADVGEVTRAVRCAVARHQVRRQFQPYTEALRQAVKLAEEGAEKAGKPPA